MTKELQKNMRTEGNFLLILMACCTLSCNNPKCNKNSVVEIVDRTYLPQKDRQIGATLNGKRNGLWVTIDSSGKVETEETYLNGKAFGVTKTFQNGILIAKQIDNLYKSDTISSYEQYSESGVILIKGQFINQLKQGVWFYYFSNGKDLKLKVLYTKKGQKILYKTPYGHTEGTY